jgi:4-hydroxy-tetrahydrodipicolinate synthase
MLPKPLVMTAMVTPFDGNQNVDLGRAKELAIRLVEEGSDGLVVSGTTGESPTLTDDEKLSLCAAVVEAVGDRATVVAGTGDNNTARSINLTERAEAAGVHAIMLTAPAYNKPPQDCLVRHFATVAEATSLPVIIYHIPARAVTRIEPATVVKLATEVENIYAIKDAGSDMNYTSEVRRAAPKDFVIYSGNDSETLPMLALGARGVISVASHVVGPGIRRMIEAFHRGDTAKALEEHLALLPVFDAMFWVTSPIPVKAACCLRGMDVGGLRPPLYEASEELKERIANVLRRHGVL